MKSCYWEYGIEEHQNQDATAIWSDKFADKYRGKRDYTEASYNYVEKHKKK